MLKQNNYVALISIGAQMRETILNNMYNYIHYE